MGSLWQWNGTNFLSNGGWAALLTCGSCSLAVLA